MANPPAAGATAAAQPIDEPPISLLERVHPFSLWIGRKWEWWSSSLEGGFCSNALEVAKRVAVFFPLIILTITALIVVGVAALITRCTPLPPEEKLSLLISQGAKKEDISKLINSIDPDEIKKWGKWGPNPFLTAVAYDRADLIPLFADANINLNARDGIKRTALEIAGESRVVSGEVVEAIIEAAQKHSIRLDNVNVAFRCALHSHNKAVTDALLTAPELEINKLDEYGRTLLCHALRENDPDAALTLIENGANIHCINREGESALDYCKNPILLQLLIDLGLDPRKNTCHGEPLLFRHVNFYKEAYFYTVGYKIQDPKLNKQCQDALESIRILLANGADPNCRHPNKQHRKSEPLIVSVIEQKFHKILEMLLAHKDIDLEARDDTGQTAMTVAAVISDQVAFSMLLKANACFNPQQYEKVRLWAMHLKTLHQLDITDLMGVNENHITKRVRNSKTVNPYIARSIVFLAPRTHFLHDRVPNAFGAMQKGVSEILSIQQDTRMRLYGVVNGARTGLLPELVDMVVDYIYMKHKPQHAQPTFELSPGGHFITV